MLPDASSKEKIVIAMSGGVDSSVAAALLKEQGHDVIGISLQLWNYSAETDDRFGTCCSLDDLADARRVADKIGIPFYILNLEKEFRREVVDTFVSEYMQGRTPIPCTLCNQKLKFDEMLDRVAAFGYQRVATGHYASIVRDASGRLTVRRGRDRNKDQSYFLFSLSQAQLARLEFPLGDLEKQAVRDRARSLDLNVADKDESHEICFIPDNNYANFIEQEVDSGAFKEGAVVDSEGRTLGTHRGYPAFTVGQRKGLNLGGLKEPYFVTKIDAAKNQITAGPKRELYRDSLTVSDVNGCLPADTPFEAEVQIRYRHRGAAARVTPLEGGRARVDFAAPQMAVAPGQAAVFYVDDCVAGGGWIE